MTSEFTVYLRAPDLTREAQIEDFQSLECVDRYCAVGAWTLTIDRRTGPAAKLVTPGYGIEVVTADGGYVLAGPMTTCRRVRDAQRNTLTVSGPDDNVWLARRLAHPQPATAVPPYSSTAYDVRTGVASTVLRAYVNANAAGGALTARQVPGLTLDVDPLLGGSVTGKGRWQKSLLLLQELALAGGVGFRVRQSGTQLLFTVYQPVDRSTTVVFSEELGNLLGFEYDSAAPSSNYLFCGGQGEEELRTIREGQDSATIADWGRIEEFHDRRDTNDTAVLDQEITTTLDENAGSAGLSLTPVDTPTQKARTHYNTGDRVTAVIDGEEIQDLIRELRTVLTPDGAQRTVPVIGATARTGVLRIFDRLRATGSRLANLERR